MIHIQRYSKDHKSTWDKVVTQADNFHFMFLRDFMDYHADRFEDCSFLILNDSNVIGVIPGNIIDSTWYSHQGLSFGGLLLEPKYYRILIIEDIFQKLFAIFKELNITKVIYKFIPHIYHKKPCDADIYALSKQESTQEIFEVSSAIKLNNRNKFSQLRIRGKKKADNYKLKYELSDQWSEYWQILSERIGAKYDKRPVHTISEILLLKNRFPNNIKLYTAALEKSICAGVVIFEVDSVAHCQYIAANDQGLSVCALDGLFDFLINHYAESDKAYFNFGISTENSGKFLNENLIQYKEGFGAQSMVHVTRHYKVN